jgi:hypothetical protein
MKQTATGTPGISHDPVSCSRPKLAPEQAPHL